MASDLVGIVAISIDNTRQGIVPCWRINRGINNAARIGGAPFRLDTSFTYFSGGLIQNETKGINVSATELVGDFDQRSILAEGNFQLAARVDNNTEVTANVQLINPPSDLIGDPFIFTVVK